MRGRASGVPLDAVDPTVDKTVAGKHLQEQFCSVQLAPVSLGVFDGCVEHRQAAIATA